MHGVGLEPTPSTSKVSASIQCAMVLFVFKNENQSSYDEAACYPEEKKQNYR